MEEEEQIEERKPQKSIGLQQALGDGHFGKPLDAEWWPQPWAQTWAWDKEQGILSVTVLPPLAGCRTEGGEA